MKRTVAAVVLVFATAASEPVIDVPVGTRVGLVVATLDGREIVAIRPDERFVPASNTKLLTTIAAFETLAVDAPDASGGAAVRLEGRDVVLVGHGDARLSSAADCVNDCLATLADAVAARRRVVRDVIGDDSAFPDERWSPGMSWNNIATRSGTAASALTLDDNETILMVTPGRLGAAPVMTGDGYYAIENRATTVAGGKTALEIDRAPNARVVRVTGTVAVGAATVRLRTSIDDPAHRAAWRFAGMLLARGVRVTGDVGVRHRRLGAGDLPWARVAAVPEVPTLTRLVPPPLLADIAVTNKTSQNLHADLMLRRLGNGSIASGITTVERVMARAGVARAAWDVSDGSGMSTYNRVSPRAMVTLLRWAAGRPWGEAFRATLPVAGVDGTLRNRFRGTALEGKLFAKTGTLNGANALAGYMTAKSGATLVFAIYAGDMPGDIGVTLQLSDTILSIAAGH
ncbi:D-alanyl-D-alanine carboxypeptidase/D-alanyl-D-alanine endopeptidase [Sphingomonas radiodurans]|uniref:D-alanyl-D-alanine carboxypeptidase/D-alanyl-D-alanine endopeptidase n=1 Tax=Sphingomonas radiodurans TaxID=2890321 RepID=UPI001E4A2268|nr:D-alanyl-D-alanine carboxypeptidase/D-alanyl-D-alanine-endopeptidase [Sphingomonas radiodurans]WBH17401.1 D-alanyl-D-alanine carboxypeptidase/D-alanyl-D-alanine-endopeptidase [Sphingomonas radiodurans]